MQIFSSRFAFPITSSPIEKGAVAVDGSFIRAVGPHDEILRKFPGAEQRDLGDVALLPGLVNAHTHLELTHFGPFKERRGLFFKESSFVDWLMRLGIRRRIKARLLGSRPFIRAYRNGLEMLRASGITCFGDITTLPEAPALVADKGLRAVLYFEAIGFNPSEAEHKAREMEEALERAGERNQSKLVTLGLSPHAPYTVSSRLYVLLSKLAEKKGIPLSVHMAESSQEVKFVMESSGEFVERLYPLIGWNKFVPEPSNMTPTGYLNSLGVLKKGTIVVHAVHVDETDIAILKKAGAGVALCPRSNFFLKVGTAPVNRFLETRIPVGLGTDSLASNKTLSLWDEMRFVRDTLRMEPSILLSMATLGGARALGLEGIIGSLEAGKEADMIAVSEEGCRSGEDPISYVVEKGMDERIRMVMVAGKEI